MAKAISLGFFFHFFYIPLTGHSINGKLKPVVWYLHSDYNDSSIEVLSSLRCTAD